MLLGGLVLIGVAVVVEQRAGEPIIPITLFKNSTVVLASVASILVGSSLYGVTVLLSQYFQIARAKSPTASGLSTIPLILGMFLTSLVVGRVITRVITKDRAVEAVPPRRVDRTGRRSGDPGPDAGWHVLSGPRRGHAARRCRHGRDHAEPGPRGVSRSAGWRRA
jgi:hypothetical protein